MTKFPTGRPSMGSEVKMGIVQILSNYPEPMGEYDLQRKFEEHYNKKVSRKTIRKYLIQLIRLNVINCNEVARSTITINKGGKKETRTKTWTRYQLKTPSGGIKYRDSL